MLSALLASALAQAQSTERVSVGPGVVQANGNSARCAISADGRCVAFVSFASNLVAGDTNAVPDVFVRDRVNGMTERVSVDSAGTEGNGGSGYHFQGEVGLAISADGRFVAFYSAASNLVAGDTNGMNDIFVRDRLNGTTERVSVSWSGAQANLPSRQPAISADGRCVAFTSGATNLVPGDTNGNEDVFVRDRQNGTTERASVGSGGTQGSAGGRAAALSADGRFVAFESSSPNLVAGDTNGWMDIFVHDRQSGTTELVSVDSGGVLGNAPSTGPAISADGRWVAFESSASNLVAPDANLFEDVFVHDRQSGSTERLSLGLVGGEADGQSLGSSISADGRYVAFWSDAMNLVLGDSNGSFDVFVFDRQSATTRRVSVDSSAVQGNNLSLSPAISGNGLFVAFESYASNLVAGDTNGVEDDFVRDLGAPPPELFCFGDGSVGACPCGNYGLFGGCENSAATGGAGLSAAGSAALANDTLVLTSSGELPGVLSIFLQGDAAIAAVHFGDGLRCTGGALKRLFAHNAAGGSVSAPQSGDLSISARSAALGDTLTTGATRYYQTYYRDPVLSYCANPPGDSWNVSSGLAVLWD